MGFGRWWHDLHAIRAGFKVVPLKTHANTSKSSNQILKTHSKSHKRSVHKITQQHAKEGLGMDSLYLNAICMGFMSLANCDAAICMCFTVVPP